jgi:N,N'-diacetyllegionaminate synthase
MVINSIEINSKKVGDNQPVYIIAEVGSNHNGNLDQAKRHIEAASKAKVDAVKFQTFRAKDHYSKHTPGFSYLNESGHTQSTYDLIESLELNRDWHEELNNFCTDLNMDFLSSACDYDAIDQLASLGMPAFKVASFDLSDVDIIMKMAEKNKPLLLSTGMATYEDIQNAINAAIQKNNNQILLLQCTSLYPAPSELANLNSIKTMNQAFGYPVGYSDHTFGDHIAIAAVALGACLIEKHFTLDRTLEGPDHAFAIEPQELIQMVKKIRDVELSLGDGLKNGPRSEEREMFEKGRRSIHIKNKLETGEPIKRDNLCVKRPGYGIAAIHLDNIIGMKVTRAIDNDRWIKWDDFK